MAHTDLSTNMGPLPSPSGSPVHVDIAKMNLFPESVCKRATLYGQSDVKISQDGSMMLFDASGIFDGHDDKLFTFLKNITPRKHEPTTRGLYALLNQFMEVTNHHNSSKARAEALLTLISFKKLL
ncbi:hypothetical protein Moror_7760, partial [Moniliophthora roreri MCA 2997]